MDLDSSGGNRRVEYRVRVVDRQDDPNRAATEGFGAVICIIRRFVAHPENGAANRKSGNNLTVGRFDLEKFFGTERCLVKCQCFAAASDRQKGRNLRVHINQRVREIVG